MKKYVFILFFIFAFLSCEKNMELTPIPLDFSRMNIIYARTGGWIHNSILRIDSTGFVEAYTYQHASDSLLNHFTSVLAETPKNELEQLFSRFSQFDSHYEPDPPYTDGNTHKIILWFKSTEFRVTVYEPENAPIPSDLKMLINKLYDLWTKTIEP